MFRVFMFGRGKVIKSKQKYLRFVREHDNSGHLRLLLKEQGVQNSCYPSD